MYNVVFEREYYDNASQATGNAHIIRSRYSYRCLGSKSHFGQPTGRWPLSPQNYSSRFAVFWALSMDALAVEVVKEYLRGHGYARTLRAFDASLLTRTVAAPAAGTAAAASKKSTAFEPPVFAATVDAALARLDKMVRCCT